ncbi:hypothetical protein EZI54_19040 [Marinobacter halodurans]|uniref:Transmembrane protein n=1 Tax=Marinobacter halodurans TaxID=2528979 RepID=A0ABY1ZJD1_9GAMM|nr:DUF6164 family protein [Marinobacter halodurans]TBW49812.1 hypothetical protein EZI54_19040 [Marinobacter halodurans]
MPHFLMNLRHVPDDEAEEIRALFEEHGVDYYETPPSRWGISMGGFWTRDGAEAERARALLATYQQSRSDTQRAEYSRRLAAGEVPSFGQRLMRRPLTVLATLLAVALILGLSVAPFLSW